MPQATKARQLTLQLAREFLQAGNYEAVGSPMETCAVASVLPTTTSSHFSPFAEYGFAGLSVQSVGYSYGADEEVVHVYVARGGKRQLAELSGEKDGVYVKMTNLGKITIRPEAASVVGIHGHVFERNGRIACGSSCAPAGENYSGTFGALAKDNGRMLALSNNHVFAGCNHIPVGQPILSPSGSDSRPGVLAPRQICRHTNIIELRSGTPALVPLVRADAAIAEVPDDTVVSSWQGNAADGYDTPVTTTQPTAGLRVKKFGRTTGLSTGVVEALIPTPMPLPYKLRYFTAKVWFTDIWTVRVADDDEHFALPGDSGSLVVTEGGDRAVGLLFAATNKGDYGFIAPIDTILHDLDLTLLGDHGL